MQIASRQTLWTEGARGTVVEVEMTKETGLRIKFFFNAAARDNEVTINWGDGSRTTLAYSDKDMSSEHVYAGYGRYKIVFEGVRCIGLRVLDGQPQYSYDAAILSFVDYSGQINSSRSAAFKKAVNLTRFVAPNCEWMGQRDFAQCGKLEEVVIGRNVICYDGTFQHCSSLVKYTAEATGICWSYVWQGCTRIAELKLGPVSQFATRDFDNTPNLMDVWISDKTVEQIKQVAPSGNIVAGYGAKFPWGANAGCRFHGTNGIVLGNGTIIRD